MDGEGGGLKVVPSAVVNLRNYLPARWTAMVTRTPSATLARSNLARKRPYSCRTWRAEQVG